MLVAAAVTAAGALVALLLLPSRETTVAPAPAPPRAARTIEPVAVPTPA